MGSPRFQLNYQDLQKWSKNALIFAGPALLVLLASFANAVPKDWQFGVIFLYLLNVLTDLLRKFLSDNTK